MADDKTLIYFSFNNENPFITLTHTNEVIAETLKEKKVLEPSSNTSDTGGEGDSESELYITVRIGKGYFSLLG